MFCVECGKEEKIYKDGVCINCYLKTHSFTEGPETLEITVCSHCNSYKYKNTWTSELFDEILQRTIKDNFQISNELKKTDITTECIDEKGGKNCNVFIIGSIEKNEITEQHNIFIKLKKAVCDVCAKRFGGYYEAVFQIRTENRKLTEDELENLRITVEDIVQGMRAKGNRTLFITDVGIEHGGLDFYLSDKGSALTIVKKVQELFGGEIKQSSKNIGMKDSRQVYRMTYLLRIPPYQKDDFISYENQFYQISLISGNKVHIVQLSNHDKKTIDSKDIQKAKIIGGKELIKEMILVSQTDKEAQIMDSKSYKTFDVKKPNKTIYDRKTVKTVKLADDIFLLDD